MLLSPIGYDVENMFNKPQLPKKCLVTQIQLMSTVAYNMTPGAISIKRGTLLGVTPPKKRGLDKDFIIERPLKISGHKPWEPVKATI